MTSQEPKFPHVKVKLVGHDGNAFTILGRIIKALRKGGATDAEVSAFNTQATSGDYIHLLVTAARWVDVY